MPFPGEMHNRDHKCFAMYWWDSGVLSKYIPQVLANSNINTYRLREHIVTPEAIAVLGRLPDARKVWWGRRTHRTISETWHKKHFIELARRSGLYDHDYVTPWQSQSPSGADAGAAVVRAVAAAVAKIRIVTFAITKYNYTVLL